MGRASKKAETLAVSINPNAFVDAIADRLFARIDAKYGRRLSPSDGPPAAAKRLLSIAEFAALTDTSAWFVRKQIRLRVIPAVRVGDLMKITAEAADAYIASRPLAQDAPPRAAGSAKPPRPPKAPAATS